MATDLIISCQKCGATLATMSAAIAASGGDYRVPPCAACLSGLAQIWSDYTSQEMFGEFLREGLGDEFAPLDDAITSLMRSEPQ